MKFIKNYQSSLKLLAGNTVGAIIGIFFSDFAMYLEPVGRLFLNMIFVLIVPLVFCSMSLAVVGNHGMGRIKKILGTTLLTFLVTALIAATLMAIAVFIYNPFATIDTGHFTSLMDQTLQSKSDARSLGMVFVETISVSNFLELFDKNHLLALILFSLFFGMTLSSLGEKTQPLVKLLQATNDVMMKMIRKVMTFAPLGLGAYFAFALGNLGPQILGGYLKMLLLYLGGCCFYYLFVISGYVYFAGGLQGLKNYWKNAFNPSLQALGTSSSAACIPVNISTLEKIGVSKDIRETVISLGANIHKDGSAMSGVLQVALLFTLFNRDLTTISSILSMIGGGLLVGIVMGSIPSGGFTAEVLLISLFGLPVEAIPVIAVISTITDMPATLINSSSNIACGMLVSKGVDPEDGYQELDIRLDDLPRLSRVKK